MHKYCNYTNIGVGCKMINSPLCFERNPLRYCESVEHPHASLQFEYPQ